MKRIYLHQADYPIKHWTGGETVEIYLSPANGYYEIGHFDFRLSTATIKLPKTDFTLLPGYKRVIMPLDKSLILFHENKSSICKVRLSPFEAHYFSGDEQTQSLGECTDFNLIFKDGYTGNLSACRDKEQLNLAFGELVIIYALQKIGVLIYQNNRLTERIDLEFGDGIVFEEVAKECQLIIDGINSLGKKPIAVVANIVEN